MWTTCTLLAGLALAPAQTGDNARTTSGDLTLNNVRATYGILGATRPNDRIIPGDIYFVAFDIDGIIVDPNGRVQYSMAMEVTDSRNKLQFKQDPRELEAINALGGNHLPAFAHVDVGLNQPAGVYNLKVTVTDRAGRKSRSLERRFEVVQPGFGLVRLNISGDPQGGVPVPGIGAAGETMWVHMVAVGFQRGGERKEPDLAIEMQVLDENDKPVLPKPFSSDGKELMKDLPKDQQGVPLDFPLPLNRAGKFTVKIKATDKLANKSTELSFPLTVMEMK